MGNTVILEREPDGGHVVKVPALPGCVTQGDTRAEVIRNVRAATEVYVEDCMDAGDSAPQAESCESTGIRIGVRWS